MQKSGLSLRVPLSQRRSSRPSPAAQNAPTAATGQRISRAGPAPLSPGLQFSRGMNQPSAFSSPRGGWKGRQERAQQTRTPRPGAHRCTLGSAPPAPAPRRAPRPLPAPCPSRRPIVPGLSRGGGAGTRLAGSGAGRQRGLGWAPRSRWGRSAPPSPPLLPGCSARAGAALGDGASAGNFPQVGAALEQLLIALTSRAPCRAEPIRPAEPCPSPAARARRAPAPPPRPDWAVRLHITASRRGD